ncbi:MAG: SIR2 family protein [Actinobacteria bacterium]|nr:SIR2 family protein [Actinomycetota bacterium]
MEENKTDKKEIENFIYIRDEFLSAYKDSQNEKHFIKLFDKIGKDNVKFEENDQKLLNEIKLRISCFFQEILKLNTVSFLFGTGSSKPLGAKSIFEIPKSICLKIQENNLANVCGSLVNCYNSFKCDKKAGCKINLEKFLGGLIRLEKTITDFDRAIKFDKDFLEKIKKLIQIIKTELFLSCNVPNIENISDDFYKNDPLGVHREFFKKILARPLNLKRISLFTTNYDLLFEKAMDDLGIIFIDGFIGNIKRIFKPEVYNYDYYFPASTTEGNVHRLDKVVHLYKLHGSLDWVECTPNSKNIFGIEQIKDGSDYNKSNLIYPQPMKEEETIGFPYSEMFRRFATIIQQPQNVLITYGYGFGDEHVNRVIFNALSISTFHLVVISYNWAQIKEFYEKVKDDARVSFLIGEYLGDWKNFVFDLLPDIKQLELEERILKTMKRLKGEEKEADNIERID